jgi:hypothetical protein
MQIARLWLQMALQFAVGIALMAHYVYHGGLTVLVGSIVLLVLAANVVVRIVKEDSVEPTNDAE